MSQSSIHSPQLQAASPPMAYLMVPGVDGSSSYPWVGRGCIHLLGVEPAELMANSGKFWSLVHPSDRTPFKLAKLKAIRQGIAFRGRCRITTESGEEKLIEVSGYPLPSSVHEFPSLWSFQAVDVGFEKRLIEEIRELKEVIFRQEGQLKFQVKSLGESHAAIARLSATDSLTAVANRLSFQHSLWREVAVAQRHGSPLALISIKLMGLRDFNRAQGVLSGDQALTRFATLLSNCLASHYTIGRPSGTVFCVLLPGADDQAINLFLQQLNSIISSDQNLSEGGLTVHAGAAFCMVEDSCDSFFQRAESQMLQRIWA